MLILINPEIKTVFMGIFKIGGYTITGRYYFCRGIIKINIIPTNEAAVANIVFIHIESHFFYILLLLLFIIIIYYCYFIIVILLLLFYYYFIIISSPSSYYL